MKERDGALNRALKIKLTSDRYCFTSLRNKVTKTIRKAKANFFMTIIDKTKGNIKLIWEQIKNLVGINHSPKKDLVLEQNDQLVQDPVQVATAFNKYFISFVDEIAQSFPLPTVHFAEVDETKTSFCILPISESKTSAIIDTFKSSTAKDVYGMDSTTLKSLKDSLVCPITQIVNLSVLQGHFPNASIHSICILCNLALGLITPAKQPTAFLLRKSEKGSTKEVLLVQCS